MSRPQWIAVAVLGMSALAAPGMAEQSTTYFFGSPNTDVTRPDNNQDVTGSAIGLIGNARIKGQLGDAERCSTGCAMNNRVCVCTTGSGGPDGANAVQATFTCRNGGLLTPLELEYDAAAFAIDNSRNGLLHLFVSRDYVNFTQRDAQPYEMMDAHRTHDLSDLPPTPMLVTQLHPQKTGGAVGQAPAQVDNLQLTGECSADGDTGPTLATGVVKVRSYRNGVCAVNNNGASQANVLVEQLDEAGNVVTWANLTIEPAATGMVMAVGPGKRWCRVTPSLGDVVRARMYSEGASLQSEDGSEAR